jgi:hypothetical protein
VPQRRVDHRLPLACRPAAGGGGMRQKFNSLEKPFFSSDTD